MTTELHWLTLTLLMTALFWVPYILERIVGRGVVKVMLDARPPEAGGTQAAWAERAIRAHRNAVENLVLFAPSVLILHALGISTPATQAAVVVYFFARLVHFVVYTACIPVARTLAFAAAWAAQIVLLTAILGWS
jgi:uncharacterized MAPEG superfamily protein